jgi:acetyl esterase/lipase
MTEISRPLVDAELIELLDNFPKVRLSSEILPAVRAVRLPFQPASPELAAIKVTTRSVPGPAKAPAVEMIIYSPPKAATARPCILHIHGGGFVAGSAASMEAAHRATVNELDCVIVSVEYRLAPEAPFPSGVEDCYAVLGWLFNYGAEIGVDNRHIGVMGESAGGGLSAALALLARDRKEYPLAFQHLIYPMLDDRTCVSPDPHPYAGEFVWTAHNNTFGWMSLLGGKCGSADVSPYAAPARAESLVGLPPTFISTAALDLLAEEDMEYARRLMRAGVPTELHVYAGAFHAFDIAPTAQVAVNARRDSLEALRRALSPLA